MKLILAMLISLGLAFSGIALADTDQTSGYTSNSKSHSCGCSKSKHRYR